MANVIQLKKSGVENKRPSTLESGEIAVNFHDGNIYYKDSSNNISELKRLDERLASIDVTNMTYNAITDDLESVTYASGNVITLNYDVDGDLDYVNYYAVDGSTLLGTQTLSYDLNKNLIGTVWSYV
jgi:hypothetical protein